MFNILKKRKEKDLIAKSIKIQDSYPVDIFNDNIAIFFVPGKHYTNGGIMSIFSLCKFSREFCDKYNFIVATVPGEKTYAKNEFFPNEENVYRWEQVIKNLKKDKEIIFHLPEGYINAFVKELSDEEIKFLSECNLHVNIMNQNIQYMPDKSIIRKLFKLTNNITQTTAHKKYSSQEICDKYGIPLHEFSTYLDISPYLKYVTDEKKKQIIFSPDEHYYKSLIKNKIRKELPEYEIIEPLDLSFDDYLKLVGESMFIITLGEGFDGYFNISPRINTLSFAVYNEEFFPSEKWKNLDNCYNSHEEMLNNIITDMKKYESDFALYKETTQKHDSYRNEIYGLDIYKNNIASFYDKKYSKLPTTPIGKEDFITVLVTTYNHENFIEEAIDSIYAQTDIPNFEVIVGNDCSTDNTAKVLEKCQEKYPSLVVINREQNLGAQYNLKDLLSRAKGDYIAILEGDDYWDSPDYLNTQYNTLLNEHRASLSFTDFKILHVDGQITHSNYGEINTFMGPKYAIMNARPSNFSCCMYRREAIERIPENYYKHSQNFCAFFNFYVLDNSSACYVKEPLMVYRYHETSVWSSMNTRQQILQAIHSLYRLSVEIPNKYDYEILATINKLTRHFNKDPQILKEKRLFKLILPYSKHRRCKFQITKYRR